MLKFENMQERSRGLSEAGYAAVQKHCCEVARDAIIGIECSAVMCSEGFDGYLPELVQRMVGLLITR
jgi:hypothetical protein